MAKSLRYPISKSTLFKLKTLLIFLTVIYVIYFGIVMSNTKLWVLLNRDYNMDWIVKFFHICITGTFIWFNWNMQYNKKKKWDNTWKILLLGIIGMWLWLPNKKEIVNLTDHKHN